VTGTRRVLRVQFANPDEFRREHDANLGNRGIFVATLDELALREPVTVEMSLAGVDPPVSPVSLDGEVVHIVPAEMAGAGGLPGVAIQFGCGKAEVKAALQPFTVACEVGPPEPVDDGRRAAPRVPALVPVHVDCGGEVIATHTRNISQSGMLVSMAGKGLPVGVAVGLTITHPTTGGALCCRGIVRRQITGETGVIALGVEFERSKDKRAEVNRFISDLQSAEHARRLGGIYGSIDEVGPMNLLQMFGKTTPSGTLTLRRGEDEAMVGFEGGLMRYARFGSSSSMKALVRLLDWTDGSFEFHARLEPLALRDAPLPLDAALLDAACMMDEERRLDRDIIPDHADVIFIGQPVGAEADAVGKLEQAVLDLSQAHTTVRRILDVIPDPDLAILRALMVLAELRAIEIRP
jgi:hypothetical protein